MGVNCVNCGTELTVKQMDEGQLLCFPCREDCPSCGGTGKVWVALAPDDGCYEPCDECFNWGN